MTPTEKHLEAARALLADLFGDAIIEKPSLQIVAEHIAKAEREGMKRAAEIALHQGDMHMPALGYVISQTILTEAEERTQ